MPRGNYGAYKLWADRAIHLLPGQHLKIEDPAIKENTLNQKFWRNGIRVSILRRGGSLHLYKNPKARFRGRKNAGERGSESNPEVQNGISEAQSKSVLVQDTGLPRGPGTSI